MKKWQIGAIVVGMGIVTYLVMDLFTTDRQRVSQLVHRLASRLEKRDGPGVCSLLAEDYRDQHPHGSRAGVRALLAFVMPQLQSLSVRVEGLQVEVSGETGTADFVVQVEAQPAARDAPPEYWSSRVKLHVKKVKGEWLIGEAEYASPRQFRMIE